MGHDAAFINFFEFIRVDVDSAEPELVCQQGYYKQNANSCYQLNEITTKITPVKINNIFKSTFNKITIANTAKMNYKKADFIVILNRHSRSINTSVMNVRATEKSTITDAIIRGSASTIASSVIPIYLENGRRLQTRNLVNKNCHKDSTDEINNVDN